LENVMTSIHSPPLSSPEFDAHTLSQLPLRVQIHAFRGIHSNHRLFGLRVSEEVVLKNYLQMDYKDQQKICL